ncbi:hypothetical protein PYCCODRAFT_1467972 [Trametes coccinea BRFM310]|uniref:GmrSD restriction endonucleases N-terminal domain-containing protein n=1 Tax=Trametes coccinea (strain BRFM310) TaxID=1353009 RepID=A0A1Y2IMJ2_TRAC3|nr:hypothetical protein PYCCODRAFT_1467972 [Trametes coccinea BRFM310]
MSDDELNSSDLTDLEEEDDVPLSARTRTKPSDASGYRIQGALKIPRATTYTCQALYGMASRYDACAISDTLVGLKIKYLREILTSSLNISATSSGLTKSKWVTSLTIRVYAPTPTHSFVGLIDSIFRNFYVPPVIFVLNLAEDGAERRVCVDGKQRLTSIYRFIAGEIPYKDAFTGERFYFKVDSKSAKGQILPERYRKMFLNKQIVCMEYQDITPENEREIFQRVQLGMALTPAERLQAISSHVTTFVRELVDTYILDPNGLAENIEWDTSRANDFRTIATAVYAMSKWPKLTTVPSFGTLEKWLRECHDLDEDLEDDIQGTFKVFCRLASDPELDNCFNIQGIKKVAPVEMLAITLLIHANKRRMSLSQLSEAITLMRHDVRQVEKDVRLNSRTMKLLINFLKKLKPAQLNTQNNEKPAASVVKFIGKRKRASSESSESEPEEPPPRRAPKSQAATSNKAVKSSRQPTPTLGPSPLPPPQPAPPPPAPSLPPPSTVHPPPSTDSSRLPSRPNGSIARPSTSQSPRLPPTAPAALRQNTSHSTLASGRRILPIQPQSTSPYQASLGDSLMARMSSAPSPTSTAAPRNSPSIPFHPGPNDFSQNRMYDPSKDPRNPAYQGDGRGQPPGPSYGRRY